MNDDMMCRFERLYDQMSASGEVKNMRLFGSVMKEMFAWFVAYKADAAENWLEKLESMKWKNYLTKQEAEEIVSKMSPKCPWRRDVWASAMEANGYALEETPYYNSCALWVTMCMIYSDSSSSIHAIMKMAGGTEGVSDKDFFAAVHMLALDKLKDADGVFDVRRYFEK
jgi:hypothetical protein